MRTRLGQNFLVDKNIVRKITDVCQAAPGITLIEIGPGKGILTEELSKRYDKIIAVELDKKLYDGLLKKFAGQQNIEIVNADFLEWNIPEPQDRYRFVANVPYYITSPIIEKVLNFDGWDIAVFMVQKEVARRIAAGENSSDRGVLSITCQIMSEAEIMFDVPPSAFCPVPGVTSSVICLKRLTAPMVEKARRLFFINTVKAAFAHRRKTIANSLSLSFGLDKNTTNALLLKSGIQPKTRPENVSISGFYALSINLGFLLYRKLNNPTT